MYHFLFLGDSITDCGSFLPSNPLGNGYVQMLAARLTQEGYDCQLQNAGVDGFTISRLLDNQKNGDTSRSCDFISVLIGINDIGLMMSTNRTSEQKQAMLQAFTKKYEQLLTLLFQRSKHILLIEPFIFPRPAAYAAWIPYVKKMSAGIQDLAARSQLPFLFLQEDLNKAASQNGLSTITMDGIHLTDAGHKILADKLFSQLTAIF